MVLTLSRKPFIDISLSGYLGLNAGSYIIMEKG